jgi:hypothetical protein
MMLEQQLLEFWAGPEREAMLNDGTFTMHVKKSNRTFAALGEICFECLDLLDLCATYRCRGRFKEILAWLKNQRTWDALYVDSVMTPRFRAFFIRDGWEVENVNYPCPSFFMPLALHPVA